MNEEIMTSLGEFHVIVPWTAGPEEPSVVQKIGKSFLLGERLDRALKAELPG